MKYRVLQYCVLNAMFLLGWGSLRAEPIQTDVLVVGAGVGGFGAAVQAARQGVNVVLVEETPWVGGMMSAAGVSAFDGNNGAFNTGLFREVRSKIEDYYGGPANVHTGWVSLCSFEPHVGQQILLDTLNTLPNLSLYLEANLKSVLREGNRIMGATIEDASGNELEIRARITIEATEYGDVMALGGVPYRLGRDSRYETLESEAPEAPDDLVQDLTYVLLLKRYPGEDRTPPEPPEGYNPDLFNCCCQEACTGTATHTRDRMMDYGELPGGKYMINWPIHGNDYFLKLHEMTPSERRAALADAKAHSLNFLYFHQAVLGLSELDLADDEYPTLDKLPFIPYMRESRRMKGAVLYRLFDIQNRYGTPSGPLFKTYIAVGNYFVDHHHVAFNRPAGYPGESFGRIPRTGVPYGALIPEDIDGLIAAEKSISVTHIVNGVTRLQPIVMLTGQAAGLAAALAVQGGLEPRQVDLRQLQQALLDTRSACFPLDDVADDRWSFVEIQKILLSGAMQSEDSGTSTLFKPYDPVARDSMKDILARALGRSSIEATSVTLEGIDPLTRVQLALLIEEFSPAGIPVPAAPAFSDVPPSSSDFAAIQLFHERGLDAGWISGPQFRPDLSVSREQVAVAIQRALDPFTRLPVEIVPEPDYSEIVLEEASPKWKLHHNASVQGWTGAPPEWFSSTLEANRDLAYNPATDHVLVTDLVNHQVHILNAQTGEDLGVLDNSKISTSARLSLAAIDCDDDGIIYATPYEKNPFRVYRWESEQAECEIVFESILPLEAGRDLEVVGSGDATRVYIARSGHSGAFLVLAASGEELILDSQASTVAENAFTNYGVYGLAIERPESVYVKASAGALYRFNRNPGAWEEDLAFETGDFDSASVSKMRFSDDGNWLFGLGYRASGPYVFDGTAASVSGGLIYKRIPEEGFKLQAAARLEIPIAHGNAAGGIDLDASGGVLFVSLPQNGIAAYEVQALLEKQERFPCWQGY